MIEPRRIEGPTTFPATLEQVKWHLRVDHDSDDDLLSEITMPAALGQIETKIRRAVMPQTWEMALDAFPSREIALPYGPLLSVEAVAYVDQSGVEQALPVEAYEIDSYSKPGWVIPTGAWPAPMATANSVRIRWIAGGDCPPEVRQAFLLLVGHYYVNREAAGASMAAIPLGVDAMLANHRFRLTLA
jgi:uncharacterized phiE125 gp8 family phage protein